MDARDTQTMADDSTLDPALPEPVRDHLGQQLRTVFTTGETVPDYLGDPAAPEAFAPQLKRLEVRLKTHEEGTVAVEQALEGLLGDLGAAPKPDEAP
ncbi:hypothetical protein ASF41_06565 [Methylobacterium sp. Leaf111]|nr:hypothetical protein ASF20_05800 [Methylobacterium sp. Leaf88]KQO67914.1 hypothetical protein ASF18_05385 [Methylobacterium sp. Leaf89]KQP67446.1 hypothetical protein ASF41_06565 [Methylobacterium sp. Leaf111]KQU34362.1 hypothetical protein ASG63_13075 [Methylobacterium sp. Leaf94]